MTKISFSQKLLFGSLSFLSLPFAGICETNISPEKGMAQYRFGYRETQESIYMRSLDLTARNKRRELFWPYEGSKSGGHDLGMDFQLNDGTSREYEIEGQRMRLIYGHQYSEQWHFEAKLGAHRSKATGRNGSSSGVLEHTNPVGELQLYHQREDGRHRLFLEYENVYTRLQLPAALSEYLRYFNIGYQGDYYVSKTHHLTGGVTQRFYSDTNKRIEANVSTMHKFSDHLFMPWLGVGISYLGTAQNRPGYWTPRSQTAYGPRIGWSYWHSPMFSAGLYSNINHYYNSSNKDSGIGHYTALMFWIGDRNKFHAVVELVRMDSAQDLGSEWDENDVFITLSHPL